ncbi:hypothetical protein GTK01_13300 [Aliihoeflea sp. 40Bstr573]|nr:hypothetical protein [Aliihoeflea sp. 40Bstr573]
MLACRLPKPGRMTLAPMLKDDGGLIGDFTVACLKGRREAVPPPLTPPHKEEGGAGGELTSTPSKLGGNEEAKATTTTSLSPLWGAMRAGGMPGSDPAEYLIFGSGVAEQFHMRWFERHLPVDGSVRVEALGLGKVGLSIAGPDARRVLEKVTRADVANAALPFMAIRTMDVAMAPCLVGRVSYTGDLGYELWMAPEHQRHVLDALLGAGEEFGMGLFGARALNALRLEKGYGSWAREYRPIYGPLEAGLDRFVAYDKATDFIGKSAAQAEKREGGKLRLRSFVVDAVDADVIGDEPIWHRGEVKGWVTSGGYAHHAGKSVAMGYVLKEIAGQTEEFEIEFLGRRHRARMLDTVLFDPDFARMRG